MRIMVINEPNTGHLEEVMAEMETLGAPTLRAYYDGEVYYALEGSHRVAAAHELGLIPELILMDDDDILTNHDIDMDGLTPGTDATLHEVFEAVWNKTVYGGWPSYCFDD